MAKMEIRFSGRHAARPLNAETEDLCKKIVDSATPIVEESWKKEIKAVVQHSGDSELVDSILATPAKKAKNGAIIAFLLDQKEIPKVITIGTEKREEKYR